MTPIAEAFVSTGVGVTTTLALTNYNPILGAGLGLLNYTARKITDLSIKKTIPQFSEEHPVYSSNLSFAISSSVTLAGCAGFMKAVNIPVVYAIIFILYVYLTSFVCQRISSFSSIREAFDFYNREMPARQDTMQIVYSLALLTVIGIACVKNPETFINVMEVMWQNQNDGRFD